VNGWFFLADRRFPAAFTALALLGWAAPLERPGRAAFAVWFAVFFGVTLLFYAGSYDYGADVRYSLASYPPLAVLAGLGVSRLVRVGEGRRATVARGVIAVAAVGQFIWLYLPVVRSTSDTAWAARADVEFARSFAANLPHDAYVLTHNPGMFQVWGVNAGQMSLAGTPADLEALGARFPGGVYLHWNYWCNADDRAHRDLCVKVRELTPIVKVGERRVGDQEVAFYRIELTQRGHRTP
jgi:hypothetical protein